MIFSPVVLSNEIIKRAIQEKIQLTPMKLQKLVFFIFGRYYAETNEKIFEEPFLVWQYGPVIQSVYDEFKSFGANNITKFATDAQGIAYFPNKECSPLGRFFSVFEDVWQMYKHYTGPEISTLTHRINAPWTKANEENMTTIPDSYIHEYFKENPYVR